MIDDTKEIILRSSVEDYKPESWEVNMSDYTPIGHFSANQKGVFVETAKQLKLVIIIEPVEGKESKLISLYVHNKHDDLTKFWSLTERKANKRG